ncbi:MAG: hypothetical protein B7X99_16455 [Rhizobiales bacterium 17-65-6]|nr:MAG: hypothetical protein B7Z30_12695 [Rhizobiales bacterium 12-68-15]OYX88119.1 MAG: hypothetical protein B7Y84_09580 [Azorhizobium sp. 32-67-21]OYY13423.1 MAG: hypothetical protein B7Y70_02170 [Rhizobiales bacterium 35-68-8]OYZ90898.1 MAG: hypothetical protein B7X99_16455 [Rhizobiales bacterium 17-65-6]
MRYAITNGGFTMPKAVLYAIIAVLVVGGGIFAYQQYEKKQDTLQIEIGPKGMKVDPPNR